MYTVCLSQLPVLFALNYCLPSTDNVRIYDTPASFTVMAPHGRIVVDNYEMLSCFDYDKPLYPHLTAEEPIKVGLSMHTLTLLPLDAHSHCSHRSHPSLFALI